MTVHVDGEYFDRHYCRKHYEQIEAKALAEYKMSFIDRIQCLLFGKQVTGEITF
jgi:hypothetical protein